MKMYLAMAVTVLAVLLLSSGGLLVTHAAGPNTTTNKSVSSQALSLTLAGGVASAGSQNYFITQNGPAIMAVIDGQMLSNTHLTYTLNAEQNDLSTSGSASFQLTGQNSTGSTISVSGNVLIGASIPAICFPSDSVTGACMSGDSSEVPAAFVGAAAVQVGSGVSGFSSNMWNSRNGNTQKTSEETLVFESAYFNPFGDAITIASLDNSIMIITNYTQATINWSHVMDEGVLGGTLGTTPISGNFIQVASESENLVSGTATDYGTVAFSGVVSVTSGNPINYMDANGAYYGTSTIPHTGASSCGTINGLQICTSTGFQDQGTFMMLGGALITGSYSTTWTVPAFAFVGEISGHATL